ncbi:hypothetical protein Gpo141_00014731, partial [Globisporangium polare]
REVSELRLRHSQLQDDVEVLAAHLETQTSEHEKERAAMRLLQNQLQHANMEMARELHSFRIENDALRRQNVLLQQQRDEFEAKATLASETQEELLLALKKQQQSEEQLQSANVHIVRERAQVRKALETTQNHCRRLEEELAAAQTLLLQLQSERIALQVAASTASTKTHNREAEQIRVQSEMINSLRADLLQMEFEFKTMAVDRDALTEKVSKLQKRLAGGGGSGDGSVAYEVIPLGQAATGSKPLSSKQQKQLLKEQEKQQKLQIQQQPQKKTIRPIRNHYESENGGFSGVMELPNFVGDHQDSSSSLSSSGNLSSSSSLTTTAPEAASTLRRRSSFSQLVSKTVSSAKKKLFVSASHN